jgi:HEAT repeat protein
LAGEYAWVHARNPEGYARARAVHGAPLTEELARGYMRDPEARVRVEVSGALFNNLGKEHYPWSQKLLLEMARDADEVIRNSALKVLLEFHRRWSGPVKAEIVAIMKAALAEANATSRHHALIFFAENYDAEVLPAVERMCADADPFVAEAALRAAGAAAQLASDPHWEVQGEARRILAKSGSAEKATLAAAAISRGKDSQLNDVVRRALTLDPAQRLDELEKMYKSFDAAQRMELLRLVRPDTSGCLEDRFLIRRLKDPDPAVRRLALQNLSVRYDTFYSQAPPRPEGAAEAIELLNDPDASVSLAAARLLKDLPYKSLIPLIAPKLLDNPADAPTTDAGVRDFATNNPDILLRCLKDKNVLVRMSARGAFRVQQWDQLELCLAVLGSVERVNELPPGAPSSGDVIPRLVEAAIKEPGRAPAIFALIARIDDERADEALKKAARSTERAIRWAALDALVARGDESDATLDHALARLLTADASNGRAFMTWPVLSPRVLERLDTFNGLIKPEKISALLAKLKEPIR